MRPILSVLAVAAISVTTIGAGDAAAAPYELRTHTPDLKKAIANKLEVKRPLKFGMIKLTDSIPIIAAKELGYFAAEGLNVSIEVQPNWKAVNDRLINGELDGSHMLYGHPLGAAIGFGASAALVVPYNICINGMGITVSNALWEAMKAKDPAIAQPSRADTLKAIAGERKAAGKPLTMFMTFPAGSHNINIRYWLAAGGVHPGFYQGLSDPKGVTDADVILTTNPPPQMAQAMAQGNCDAFCVGEPWNMLVTMKEQTGRMVMPSHHLVAGSPDKVFAMTEAFTNANPNTTKAIVRALIRAGRWLDESMDNRRLAASMLAHKSYIGADVGIISESITGTLTYNMDSGKADRRPEPDFNVFSKKYASYPLKTHAVWGLTQFRRWGMVPETKPDAWYQQVADRTWRPDLYKAAFDSLVADGLAKADEVPADDLLPMPAEAFIDRIPFDPRQPNAYLQRFTIGLK